MIAYIKMTNGDDLVCSVDVMPMLGDESIEIKNPFALKIQKEYGFYEYSAYRWDMFLKDRADSVYWIPQRHIMLFGQATDNLVEMYVDWTKENDVDDDVEEEEDHHEYMPKSYDIKKVH
jgi:hypothetical protein